MSNTHRIVDNSWAINGYPTSKYQERLSYDANGNVLTLQRTNENAQVVDNLSMTYKSGTNQLQSVIDAAGANKLYGWDAGSTTNSYDLNGNIMSGDGATNISYDVRNLPTSLQKNGKTITYRYNAAGQRIYKKVIGTTTTEEHYVMNGSELVAVIKNGAVSYWKTSYGRYEKSGSGYTAYYYLTDHLGSTRVVLREDGIRTEAYDYYAFGLTLPGRTYGSGTKEKFTGKERDLETGWDYFGARYYNPSIARWMNVDPILDELDSKEIIEMELFSYSPYNYVYNNPTQITDPDGKCPFCPVAGAVVGASVEYGTQVVGNFINGKSGVDAFTDVDFADIGIAAVEGALTSGASVGKQMAINAGAELIRNTIDVKSGGVTIETNATVVVANTAVGVATNIPIQSKVLTNVLPNRTFDTGAAVRSARNSSNTPLSRTARLGIRQQTQNSRTAFRQFRQGISDGAINLFPGGSGSALQDRTSSESGNQRRVSNNRREGSSNNSSASRGQGGHHRGITNTRNHDRQTRGRGN